MSRVCLSNTRCHFISYFISLFTATAALLVLRDLAFQRDNIRGSAIGCAVAIAAGRLPASPPIQDKALKLVMNIIFLKNDDCASKVIESATFELESVVKSSIENHSKILSAKEGSDEEKAAIDGVLKPVVLFMALCVRRPEIIKVIMEASCRERADIMAKAVKANMPKLAKAASAKHGMPVYCSFVPHAFYSLINTFIVSGTRGCEYRTFSR